MEDQGFTQARASAAVNNLIIYVNQICDSYNSYQDINEIPLGLRVILLRKLDYMYAEELDRCLPVPVRSRADMLHYNLLRSLHAVPGLT
jgi:hypothetical protein